MLNQKTIFQKKSVINSNLEFYLKNYILRRTKLNSYFEIKVKIKLQNVLIFRIQKKSRLKNELNSTGISYIDIIIIKFHNFFFLIEKYSKIDCIIE